MAISVIALIAAAYASFRADLPVPKDRSVTVGHAPLGRLPIVIWHTHTNLPDSAQRISILLSDKVEGSFPQDQRYPIRGFVIGNVEGSLCAFASKDLVGPRMPGIFGEMDLWGPCTTDGALLMRYLPDGLPDYEIPITRGLKGNRALSVKMPLVYPRVDEYGGERWKVDVTNFALKPIENDKGFQEKQAENGQSFYRYEALDSQMPSRFPPEKNWIGNGVYRLGQKVGKGPSARQADVLVGIVWGCSISIVGTAPPKMRAIISVAPLTTADNSISEDVHGAVLAAPIAPANLSSAK